MNKLIVYFMLRSALMVSNFMYQILTEEYNWKRVGELSFFQGVVLNNANIFIG